MPAAAHHPVVSVWRIHTYEVPDNAYTVGRRENWVAKPDREFDDLEAAKAYIRGQTRMHTTVANHLINLPPSRREAFLDDFCFTDDRYMKDRRFFIDRPPVKDIQRALERDGVTVAA
jgi:hypothetical protein